MMVLQPFHTVACVNGKDGHESGSPSIQSITGVFFQICIYGYKSSVLPVIYGHTTVLPYACDQVMIH